ncbi:hypothetical protein HS7_19960 [Sulfolobales archaeon HS-7]|nr:hypothetical protein HS7_19960 [Sulfolobales archaeon HS-7]
MSKKQQKDFYQIVSSYPVVIVMLILAIGFIAILAIPYYVSPLTYENGGHPSGINYLVLLAMIFVLIVSGIYLMDHGNATWGFSMIIVGLLFGVMLIWLIYGASALHALG